MERTTSAAVFCGSAFGNRKIYEDKAVQLGKEMASRGMALVYGGGARGLMGACAESCFQAGGKVIGVLPEIFHTQKVLSRKVETELVFAKDMHERKKRMYDLSDAFIVLPGGIGTMDEFFEIFTWRQIGYHRKNIALLDAEGFFTPLLAYLDQMVETGFLRREMRDFLIVEEDATRLLDRLGEEKAELFLKY